MTSRLQHNKIKLAIPTDIVARHMHVMEIVWVVFQNAPELYKLPLNGPAFAPELYKLPLNGPAFAPELYKLPLNGPAFAPELSCFCTCTSYHSCFCT